jgi:hypothetical protein
MVLRRRLTLGRTILLVLSLALAFGTPAHAIGIGCPAKVCMESAPSSPSSFGTTYE